MRENTDRLDAAKATDAWTSELLGRVLARRVASLQDDPRTTLFFGRIDTRTEHGRGDLPHRAPARPRRPRATRSSSTGAPPISTAFYRASPTRADGRRLRRRFGVDRGRLTAYEDEHLTAGPTADRAQRASSPPRSSGPASGPMRDIVVDDPARAGRDRPQRPRRPASACRARPGTGKTAVGLHRAAWLLYAYRDAARPLRRARRRPEPVLPRPHRRGAPVARRGAGRPRHVDDAARARSGCAPTTPPTSRCSRATRGWPRCCAGPSGRTSAAPTRRWSCRAGRDAGGCRPTRSRTSSTRCVARGRALLRRPAACCRSGSPTPCCSQMERVRRRPRRPGAGRRGPVGAGEGLRRRALAGARPGRACSSGSSRTPRRSPPRPTASSPPRSSGCCCGTSPPRTKGAARWSPADMALLDELADLLDRTPSLGHVVLDEAQDLSPMQLRAVGRRVLDRVAHRARRHRPGHHAVGHRRRGTTRWATSASRTHELVVLDRGFRVPAAGHRLRRPPAAAHGAGPRGAESRCATTPAGSTVVATDAADGARPR